MAAAYTGEREQFGRPIGSFQAIQQRMADAFIDVEAIRWTTWHAAWLLERGPTRHRRGKHRQVLGRRGRDAGGRHRPAGPRRHRHRRQLSALPILPVGQAQRTRTRLGHPRTSPGWEAPTPRWCHDRHHDRHADGHRRSGVVVLPHPGPAQDQRRRHRPRGRASREAPSTSTSPTSAPSSTRHPNTRRSRSTAPWPGRWPRRSSLEDKLASAAVAVTRARRFIAPERLSDAAEVHTLLNRNAARPAARVRRVPQPVPRRGQAHRRGAPQPRRRRRGRVVRPNAVLAVPDPIGPAGSRRRRCGERVRPPARRAWVRRSRIGSPSTSSRESQGISQGILTPCLIATCSVAHWIHAAPTRSPGSIVTAAARPGPRTSASTPFAPS